MIRFRGFGLGFKVEGVIFLVIWDPMGGWVFLCYWIMLLNKRILGLEMLNPNP